MSYILTKIHSMFKSERLKDVLEKAIKNHSGLVPVKRTVTRKGGKTYQATYWMTAEQYKKHKNKMMGQEGEEGKDFVRKTGERQVKVFSEYTKEDIEKLKSGDKEALTNFYKDNDNWFNTKAEKALKQSGMLDDAKQEALIEVFEKIDKFNVVDDANIGATFQTWLSNVVNNRLLNWFNEMQRQTGKGKYDKEGGYRIESQQMSLDSMMEDSEGKRTIERVKDPQDVAETAENAIITEQIKKEIENMPVDEKKKKRSLNIFDGLLSGKKKKEIADELKVTAQYIGQLIKEIINPSIKKYSVAKSLNYEIFNIFKSVFDLEIEYPILKPAVQLEKSGDFFGAIPYYTNGKWNYTFFKAKEVPIGTISEHGGKKMKKVGKDKWEEFVEGKDTKKEKPEGKENQPKKEITPEQREKIKHVAKKVIEAVGDIFTKEDIGVSSRVQDVQEVTDTMEANKRAKEAEAKLNQRKKEKEKNGGDKK